MTKKNSASELEFHLGYWLRFVSNHVSHAFALKVEAKGVTVAEWVMMRELHELDEVNPSLVADRMGMTRGAISKIVEKLCAKGLVVRKSIGDDKRYQLIQLTSKGRKLVPQLARMADDNDEEFFGVLTDKQRSDLMETMRRLVVHHGWKDVPVQ